MSDEFIRRIKNEITRDEQASAAVIAEIEDELQRSPSARLWILHGDAIQLADEDEYDIEDAEESYVRALELDPKSAEAYESLGHFVLAVHEDAGAALQYFQRALELGAGASAREGMREAEEALASWE